MPRRSGDRRNPGGAAPSAAPRALPAPAETSERRARGLCRGGSPGATGAALPGQLPEPRSSPWQRPTAPRPCPAAAALWPRSAPRQTQRSGAGSGLRGGRCRSPERGRTGDPHPSRAGGGDTSAPWAWEVPAAGTPRHLGFGGVPACRNVSHRGSDSTLVIRIFPRHTGNILRSSFHSENTLCFRDS